MTIKPAKRFVLLDPDGSAGEYLAVIVLHPTGIVYEQQCGGVACDLRSAEGYYVPLGGARFDAETGRIDVAALTAPFHTGETCLCQDGLAAVRLADLIELVRSIPYWSRVGDEDVRAHLELDQDRLSELREAWVPVRTPDGPAILTWPNCD